MAELGPHLTLACPVCKQPVRVEITVVGHASSGSHVLAELDKSEADRHLAECVGRAPVAPPAEPSKAVATTAPAVPQPELAGRISRMLDMRAYVTPGKRACLFCGTENAKCLEALAGSHAACCSACGEYDTHPVPHGDKTCAEWAAEHGAKN